jgi:glycosyltransferase involved in cell wall biosynthesis
MVLFLHHRYRVAGGEERVVEDLAWLTRTRLGEDTALLTRDSATVGAASAAAGLLGGGLRPDVIARAVRESGARIVHAHNLLPTLGWRALAAARAAGARTVVHLHQYRLVCAIGVCFRDGHECVECHGVDTLPGIRHNCRGSRPESLVYGAGIALGQRRLLEHADAVVVPSAAAAARLGELGVVLPSVHVVPGVVRTFADPAAAAAGSPPRHGALVAARLAPEKGVDVAIDACARAGVPLTVAGDGPDRPALEARAADRRRAGAQITFLGRVDPDRLAELRDRAAVAIVASRSAETFGLAAAEAMAAGLPVAASRIGALPELVPGDWLSPPGDAVALAEIVRRLAADPAGAPDASVRAIAAARARTDPEVVAEALRAAYDQAGGRAPRPSPT